jgi:hypothetical protein
VLDAKNLIFHKNKDAFLLLFIDDWPLGIVVHDYHGARHLVLLLDHKEDSCQEFVKGQIVVILIQMQLTPTRV